MTMTHTANAEPRLPHDYTTPPAAPVREYRMTPEEAARYPAVRPTRADFSDAAEQGWTPDRFAATYGRDVKHTDILRRAFRSVLDARDMRRRRGEDEDERTPVERSGPAVTNSQWIDRIKAVLRQHPDWSRRQVAEALGTTTGTVNNAMVRCGTNLTELRARVQRELAEAADNAAEIVDTGVQTTDKIAEVNSVPVPVGNEWLTQVEVLIRKHPHWRICDYAKSLGITQKALEQRLHHRGLRLKELKLELIHGCVAPTDEPTLTGRETDIPVVCRGCGATATKATETLYHNPVCPLIGPDLAEAPPQPADMPSPASGRESQTCPICNRATTDCDHEGDCERSGRHGVDEVPEPIDVELSVISVNSVTRETCAICGSEMQCDGGRFHCPPCEMPIDPTTLEAPPSPSPSGDARSVAGSICSTCVKADVCRHAATLADWFEYAKLPDMDLDIELDIVVRRCEAYRSEGAA